jgi:hypothetical protein
MNCRNIKDDVKTGIFSHSRDKSERHLVTALMAFGIEAA